jgi:hypothetical protein
LNSATPWSRYAAVGRKITWATLDPQLADAKAPAAES